MGGISWGRSVWGIEPSNYRRYFEALRSDGFEVVEIGTPESIQEAKEISNLASDQGLEVIAQIWTMGTKAESHFESAKKQIDIAAEIQPVLINSHTGCDHYEIAENIELINLIENYTKPGIKLVHETHRGRATYAAHVTKKLLEAIPSMKLCLDLSHWMCVHESLLQDQEQSVAMAIARSSYVHARVGSTQSSQIDDWLDPHFSAEVAQTLNWWKKWIDQQTQKGEVARISPEWGPFPYARVESLSAQEDFLNEKNGNFKKWFERSLS